MTRIRTKRGVSFVLGLTAAILAAGAVPRAADAQQIDVDLCNSQGEDLDAAIQACTRLLEPGRGSVSVTSVFNTRGLIWLRKGEHDRAIRDFDETINRDPKNAFAYRYRGIAWFQKDEFDRAILEYNKAIEIDKAPASLASAYKLRGIALSAKGEFERAIADYDRSIKLDASSFSTFKYRGDTWLRKERLRARARRLQPGDQAFPEGSRPLQRSCAGVVEQGRFQTGARRLRRGDPAQSEQLAPLQQPRRSPAAPR